MTPVDNRWVVESFVDLTMAQVRAAQGGAHQRSSREGYRVKELIQASVGGNPQKNMAVTVYVWFLATQFLDVGGSVEIHAPQSFQLRCSPQVEYITLPAGTCKLIEVADTGGGYHHALSLKFT